ncbi:MAG: hypothetical protein GF384_06680 [Elusimicrobia bacterium]|nr:hypothetical protein [Elusimicrobiota bacterium]MBD3412389.1 hypothetical protein [Elusimicrobiota bacterium]
MHSIVHMILFLVVFQSVYAAMHFYVFARTAVLLGFPRNSMFYVLFSISTLSFIIAHVLMGISDNLVTRIIFFAAAVWMGIIFIALSLLIAYELFRFIIPVQPRYAGVSVIALTIGLSVYACVHSTTTRLKPITIKTSKIDEPVTVMYLSDLHLGSPRWRPAIKPFLRAVAEYAPDFICINGDLIDSPFPVDKALLKQFASIDIPILVTTGNHEHYYGIERVKKLLDSTGMRLLINETLVLNALQVIGIDDSDHPSQLEQALSNIIIDDQRFTLLLYHRPQGIDAAVQNNIDLMVAGHVHNGQIFPFNLLVRIFYNPIKGLHKRGSTHIYVSPGSGTWGPPMRLGSTNEITIFHILPV